MKVTIDLKNPASCLNCPMLFGFLCDTDSVPYSFSTVRGKRMGSCLLNNEFRPQWKQWKDGKRSDVFMYDFVRPADCREKYGE
jgi:hypothetical protein